MDLRKRVLAACDVGHRTRDVARTFDVSESWVRRMKQRRREAGDDAVPAPRPKKNGRYPLLDEQDRLRLREAVDAKSDATLEELRQTLGLSVSLPTLWRALRELRITFKKRASSPTSRTART